MNCRAAAFGLWQFARGTLCLAGCGVLAGCGAATGGGSSAVTVSLSPQPISIPAGNSVTFTASVSGSTATPQWGLIEDTGTNSGCFAQPGANSFTATYTAPPTPPVYILNGLYSSGSLPQGTVDLYVYLPPTGAVTPNCNDPFTCPTGTTANFFFVITAPSITVGIAPATASVALGATAVISGYCAGGLNNAENWQVNGITGGSTTYGTIAPTPGNAGVAGTPWLYTAPANMPVTGPKVTVSLVSQADPTKSASAAITLH